MPLRKQSERSAKSRSTAWADKSQRNYSKLVFWSVLAGLFGLALIWSVSRDQSPSITLDLSQGVTPVIEEINSSTSLRQLREVRDEASALLQNADFLQLRPLLEVVDSATSRLEGLERSPEKRTACLLAQLNALTDLDRLALGSSGELQWHQRRLMRIGNERTRDPAPPVRRAARRCQLLAFQLQLQESQRPLPDLESFSKLLADVVNENQGDLELLTLIEGVWQRSPTSPEYLPQLEQLTNLIQEQLQSSQDPATANRIKGLGERYWMVAWKLREKTEQAVLEQDQSKLAELQRAALQLLGSNPTNDGISVALKLAAALEGNGMFEAAKEIQAACQQLTATQATPEELAECHRLAEESLQRIELIGQSPALQLDTLRTNPVSDSELASNSPDEEAPAGTVILQFFGSGEELETLETFCRNLQALRPKGYRLLLVPCDLPPEEVDRLLLVDNLYRFETVTPSAAQALQRSLHQSATPRTMVFKTGKLVFSGLPNRRLYLELEQEAFTKPNDRNQ
jgi:hypothetical protein